MYEGYMIRTRAERVRRRKRVWALQNAILFGACMSFAFLVSLFLVNMFG